MAGHQFPQLPMSDQLSRVKTRFKLIQRDPAALKDPYTTVALADEHVVINSPQSSTGRHPKMPTSRLTPVADMHGCCMSRGCEEQPN